MDQSGIQETAAPNEMTANVFAPSTYKSGGPEV